MNIANSRYHKVRKIEKSEQNKVGKNEKIGIIRLEKLNIMYNSANIAEYSVEIVCVNISPIADIAI